MVLSTCAEGWLDRVFWQLKTVEVNPGSSEKPGSVTRGRAAREKGMVHARSTLAGFDRVRADQSWRRAASRNEVDFWQRLVAPAGTPRQVFWRRFTPAPRSPAGTRAGARRRAR